MIRTPIGDAELRARYGKDQKPIVKDGISVLVQHLKNRIKQDKQNLVIIDGPTGTGKSSLAVHIATLLNPKWDMELNYIYDEDDLRVRMDTVTDKNPVFLMDEGSIILNSKNSLCRTDKQIVSLFDAMRVKHITTIICCPNAMKINKTILTDHVDFRLLCPSKSPLPDYKARGFVHVHSHWHATWTDKDAWPFIFTTTFPKMTRAQTLQYNALKERSLNRLITKFVKGES